MRLLTRIFKPAIAITALSMAMLAQAASYSAVAEDDSGAVATVNALATQAGMNALAKGGNAIDAAVAAALTLGVVDSHNSGIGGGLFAVVHWADGRIEAIDGREMAPAAAHRDMYLRNGEADGELSVTGPLAIGVPGSVAVFEYMLKQGGKLSYADALLPAADIAEQGFAIDNIYARRLTSKQKTISQFPASAQVLLAADGEPWPVGHKLVQKDLAQTYRAIAKEGSAHFYKGDFAKKLAAWMKISGGLITEQDMANYQMKLRQPVVSQYRDYTVVGFPPPSSGGVHVAQILNTLERFDLAALSDTDRYHVIAEAMKLAFADRAYWLGDPDFVNVPKGLIDKAYGKTLSSKISLDKALAVTTHGTPPRAEYDLFGKHTTHIATADKAGNWVAITTTVNTTFGSKVIIPGTGVVMNNQMDDFSAQPGVPNIYGLVGTEANSIQPGKRPLSSMSPTIVLKGEKPIMTIGAAGGPTIITQVVLGLINHLDLNKPLYEAIAMPRIHHQWQPENLYVEKTMPPAIRSGLEAKGHSTKTLWPYGSTQTIAVDSKGQFTSVAEPRLKERNKAQ
ncbi:gamma-glutamyltransferase [Dasania marina]|uniref:gamma-glutamyltransferase n=1 Tax=Dasania marina TaxID=471499 RepID=UPI0003619245|nr:gamma-glutamyltransferase [Dasania marina]